MKTRIKGKNKIINRVVEGFRPVLRLIGLTAFIFLSVVSCENEFVDTDPEDRPSAIKVTTPDPEGSNIIKFSERGTFLLKFNYEREEDDNAEYNSVVRFCRNKDLSGSCTQVLGNPDPAAAVTPPVSFHPGPDSGPGLGIDSPTPIETTKLLIFLLGLSLLFWGISQAVSRRRWGIHTGERAYAGVPKYRLFIPLLTLAIFSLSCGELIERPKDASPILSFIATPAPILSVGTWYYEIKVTSEGKEDKETGELHVGLKTPAMFEIRTFGAMGNVVERLLSDTFDPARPTFTLSGGGGCGTTFEIDGGTGQIKTLLPIRGQQPFNCTVGFRDGDTMGLSFMVSISPASDLPDVDGDGVVNALDLCAPGGVAGMTGWTSNAMTDNDSDGCRDSDEDLDDDNDMTPDTTDVDEDGDGLIEIATLAQLNMVRDRLQGGSLRGNSTGCGGGRGVTACNGYELMGSLNFADADNNGEEGDAYDGNGFGTDGNFTPVGANTTQFRRCFRGQRLYDNRPEY